MKTTSKLLAVALLAGLLGMYAGAVRGHKESPLQPVAIQSANRKFVVRMEPKPKGVYGEWGRGPGLGTVYEIGKDKQQLWSVPFYSDAVLLTNDGEKLLALGPSHVGTEKKLAFMEGSYGFMDKSGILVIKPQFEGAHDFSEGLAVVWTADSDKEGYVNKNGVVVIAPQFDEAGDFHQGLASVRVGEKWGYINKSGKIVIKPQFEEAGDFHEGLARIYLNGKYGYLDLTGRVMIKPQFTVASEFHEGLSGVKVGEKFGFINKTGHMVIKPQDGLGYDFSEGLSVISSSTQQAKGYIDKAGKIVVKPQFDDAGDFHEGLARVVVAGKNGFIDKAGKIVIKPQFRQASHFSEGRAMVLVPPYGYTDRTGKLVIESKYAEARDFHEGMACVQVFGGKGFIDTTGKLLIKPKSNDAESFHEGLAKVKIFDPAKSKFLAEPAIEFYRKGKLTKKYLVRDLIPAPTRAMKEGTLGGGHMPWRRGNAVLSADERTASLSLFDGTTCTFDVETGKLLERRPASQ